MYNYLNKQVNFKIIVEKNLISRLDYFKMFSTILYPKPIETESHKKNIRKSKNRSWFKTSNL